MDTLYSLSDGSALVKAARYAIDLHLKSPKFDYRMMEPQVGKYDEKRGIFVTLEHYPTRSLRGCIGFSKPEGPMGRMLIEAAVAAASRDERFVSVSEHEMSELVIEVSILSKPEKIVKNTAEARKREIKIGRDGLIIYYGFKSGLLLPVVPVEQEWNKDQFLEALCEKAQLPPGTWKRADVNLYKFTAQVFREISPDGEVKEVRL